MSPFPWSHSDKHFLSIFSPERSNWKFYYKSWNKTEYRTAIYIHIKKKKRRRSRMQIRQPQWERIHKMGSRIPMTPSPIQLYQYCPNPPSWKYDEISTQNPKRSIFTVWEITSASSGIDFADTMSTARTRSFQMWSERIEIQGVKWSIFTTLTRNHISKPRIYLAHTMSKAVPHALQMRLERIGMQGAVNQEANGEGKSEFNWTKPD